MEELDKGSQHYRLNISNQQVPEMLAGGEMSEPGRVQNDQRSLN